jgi:ketosteroid isomerase-like protein
MKRLLISMTILTFLFVPQFALGSDVDDLKAAFEKMVNAYISLDAETLASLLHPGCVYYNTVAAFPDVTPMNISQKDLIRIINDSFDKVEHFSMTPYNIQYMVVGKTGIAWGHATMTAKLKEGPTKTDHARLTSAWIKSDGKWLNISYHASRIPSGD